MVTITINEKSKQAKAIIEMLKTFDFVEFKDKEASENIYSPEFVEMVKKAAKSKKRTRVNADNLWENI